MNQLAAEHDKPINSRERYAMRHALGLDNPDAKGRSYRNRYSTGHDAGMHDTWKRLEAIGYAEILRTDRNFHHYALTLHGAQAVLVAGETLDPEDFQ